MSELNELGELIGIGSAKLGITAKGTFEDGATYSRFDLVTKDGNSYLAKTNTNSPLPTNTQENNGWIKLTTRGQDATDEQVTAAVATYLDTHMATGSKVAAISAYSSSSSYSPGDLVGNSQGIWLCTTACSASTWSNNATNFSQLTLAEAFPAIDNTLTVSGEAADAEKTGLLFAPAFSTTKTYKAGDYTNYQGTIYRCFEDINTAGSWVQNKWHQISTANSLNHDIDAINNKINEVNKNLFNTTQYIMDNYLVQSGNNAGSAAHVTQSSIGKHGRIYYIDITNLLSKSSIFKIIFSNKTSTINTSGNGFVASYSYQYTPSDINGLSDSSTLQLNLLKSTQKNNTFYINIPKATETFSSCYLYLQFWKIADITNFEDTIEQILKNIFIQQITTEELIKELSLNYEHVLSSLKYNKEKILDIEKIIPKQCQHIYDGTIVAQNYVYINRTMGASQIYRLHLGKGTTLLSGGANPTNIANSDWEYGLINNFIVGHKYLFGIQKIYGESSVEITKFYLNKNSSSPSIAQINLNEDPIWECTESPELLILEIPGQESTFNNCLYYWYIIDTTIRQISSNLISSNPKDFSNINVQQNGEICIEDKQFNLKNLIMNIPPRTQRIPPYINNNRLVSTPITAYQAFKVYGRLSNNYLQFKSGFTKNFTNNSIGYFSDSTNKIQLKTGTYNEGTIESVTFSAEQADGPVTSITPIVLNAGKIYYFKFNGTFTLTSGKPRLFFLTKIQNEDDVLTTNEFCDFSTDGIATITPKNTFIATGFKIRFPRNTEIHLNATLGLYDDLNKEEDTTKINELISFTTNEPIYGGRIDFTRKKIIQTHAFRDITNNITWANMYKEKSDSITVLRSAIFNINYLNSNTNKIEKIAINQDSTIKAAILCNLLPQVNSTYNKSEAGIYISAIQDDNNRFRCYLKLSNDLYYDSSNESFTEPTSIDASVNLTDTQKSILTNFINTQTVQIVYPLETPIEYDFDEIISNYSQFSELSNISLNNFKSIYTNTANTSIIEYDDNPLKFNTNIIGRQVINYPCNLQAGYYKLTIDKITTYPIDNLSSRIDFNFINNNYNLKLYCKRNSSIDKIIFLPGEVNSISFFASQDLPTSETMRFTFSNVKLTKLSEEEGKILLKGKKDNNYHDLPKNPYWLGMKSYNGQTADIPGKTLNSNFKEVVSTTHIHAKSNDHMSKIERCYDHVALSNYYPSVPWYPLENFYNIGTVLAKDNLIDYNAKWTEGQYYFTENNENIIETIVTDNANLKTLDSYIEINSSKHYKFNIIRTRTTAHKLRVHEYDSAKNFIHECDPSSDLTSLEAEYLYTPTSKNIKYIRFSAPIDATIIFGIPTPNLLLSPNAEHARFTNISEIVPYMPKGQYGSLHFCSVGSLYGDDPTNMPLNLYDSMNKMIEQLQFSQCGGITINHPVYTEINSQDIINIIDHVNGIFAFEIFHSGANENSLPAICTGESPTIAINENTQNSFNNYWNEILSTGRQIFGVAVPDHSIDSRGYEYGIQGTTNKKVYKKPFGYCHCLVRGSTEQEILFAYANGRFYTSDYWLKPSKWNPRPDNLLFTQLFFCEKDGTNYPLSQTTEAIIGAGLINREEEEQSGTALQNRTLGGKPSCYANTFYVETNKSAIITFKTATRTVRYNNVDYVAFKVTPNDIFVRVEAEAPLTGLPCLNDQIINEAAAAIGQGQTQIIVTNNDPVLLNAETGLPAPITVTQHLWSNAVMLV